MTTTCFANYLTLCITGIEIVAIFICFLNFVLKEWGGEKGKENERVGVWVRVRVSVKVRVKVKVNVNVNVGNNSLTNHVDQPVLAPYSIDFAF